MTDEQFKQLNEKLDKLDDKFVLAYNDAFQWANTIVNRQQQFESQLGFDTTPRKFIPYYYPLLVPTSTYPEIFNKHGERMEIFFISDRVFAHNPNNPKSRYILWDRFNYGNDTHFYTHDEVFRTVGKPKRRFAILMEPRSIMPQSYENILKHRDYVEKNFDMLFTHDALILDTLSNARFVPFSANVWYGFNLEGCMLEGANAGFVANGKPKTSVNLLADNYRYKTKNVSMIASAKEICPMHIVRKKLAFKCKSEHLADTYGKFDGGPYVEIEVPFKDYRYSIVVENGIEPFYFTEKIMNCFAAQTIPIYLGATQIDKFFNVDGIIQIGLEDCDHIEKILKLCTVEEYERRLPAVLDNFNRAMQAAAQTRFDDIYVNYLKGNL